MFTGLSLMLILLKLFCCLSVLRRLKRPGPGGRGEGGDKQHEDKGLQDHYDYHVVYGDELSSI